MSDENKERQTSEGEAALQKIMQGFGIVEWQNLGPAPLPHAADLQQLLLEIDGQRYVLRERAEGPTEDDPEHRYRFQRFLQLAGIPIPPLRLTPAGEPSVALGEDSFELQQWPEGELFDSADPRSLSRIAAAGAMLGRIHQASLRYPGAEHRWPLEVQAGGMVKGWLDLARARAGASDLNALSAALLNWVEQWEAVLPGAMMSIGAVHGLPEFHIHGDYHALNLRFSGQQVQAVLGFYASRWEKRLLEVASALFYFSALQWEPESGLTRPLTRRGLDPERARAFLEAYGAVYPPAPNEAPLLADALALTAPIATANGPLEDLFFPEEQVEHEMVIDDVLERIAWASSLPAWLPRARRSLAEMWHR